jgi:hypothetical protein
MDEDIQYWKKYSKEAKQAKRNIEMELVKEKARCESL